MKERLRKIIPTNSKCYLHKPNISDFTLRRLPEKQF